MGQYFPFKGGNYHSPLVAIKVTPKTDGQLLHVECRAWFDGVEHVTKDKMGLVQFEVHVHKKGVKWTTIIMAAAPDVVENSTKKTNNCRHPLMSLYVYRTCERGNRARARA